MLPSNEQMVLKMEHAVPPTAISSSSLSSSNGVLDYTAAVLDAHAAGIY